VIRFRVCGLGDIEGEEAFAPDTLVSVVPVGFDTSSLRPKWIEPDRHHVFHFDDVENAFFPGAPTEQDVAALIDLGRALIEPDGTKGVIIHCVAGVSRSTATGFIYCCMQLGPGREEEALREVVHNSASGFVCPNSLIVGYADRLLERDGEMNRVIHDWKLSLRW
jgi:predicted protein tyrosine phosphatase